MANYLQETFMRGMALLMITTIFLAPLAGCAGADEETTWKVKISYDGGWSGSVGGASSASYEGTGDRTITVSGDIVAAVIQKDEDNSNELCVELLLDGEIKQSSCTTAGYGVVSVSEGNFTPGFGFLGAMAVLCLSAIFLNRNNNG